MGGRAACAVHGRASHFWPRVAIGPAEIVAARMGRLEAEALYHILPCFAALQRP